MKVRVRLTLLVMLGLVAAGSIALLVNAIAYQDATYKSPTQFSDALLAELKVPKSVAEAYVKQHPEAVFQADDAANPQGSPVDQAFQRTQRRLQSDAVNRSRSWTVAAIAVLTLIAGAIGWFISGRALRPLRVITSRARSASAHDLSERVGLEGPADELKDLADTFDDMLDRLEHSFAAQRGFSSQVSHELRTPIAIARTEADVLLASSPSDGVRTSAENIRRAMIRAERIVAALLALARAEGGGLERDDLALDEIVGDTLAATLEADEFDDIRVDVDLHPTPFRGDVALVESIARNLIDNAARHNRPGGWVNVRVATETVDSAAHAVLEITNSIGTQPDARATRGIGLAVVSAAASAQGGTFIRHTSGADVNIARIELPVETVHAVTPVHSSGTAT